VALPPARWQLAQLPGRTPACENGPLAGSAVVPAVADKAVVPAVARGFGPETVGLPVGLPAGRIERPLVGLLGLALAAAAAAKPPVGLWQSMQSEVAVLFSCEPSVLVP
jgi:hypothetical protein